jgi:hypothetical protein
MTHTWAFLKRQTNPAWVLIWIALFFGALWLDANYSEPERDQSGEVQ